MEADSTVLYADMADADKREAWLNEVADKANATPLEIDELHDYVREWMADVEHEFR